tara:strand:- start:5775 stop:6029 length:255 start_codon:yes stop_codon:yes gene_type:complete
MRTKEELQNQIRAYEELLANSESSYSDAVLEQKPLTETMFRARVTSIGGFIGTLQLLADLIDIDIEDIHNKSLPFLEAVKEDEL